MKKLAVLLIAMSLAWAAHAQKEKKPIGMHNGLDSLTVESPNGGETLIVGSIVTIRWDASRNLNDIRLSYSFGEGSLNWIDSNTPTTGSYAWKVDIGNHVLPAKVKIRIIAYQTGVGSVTDESDEFFTVLAAPKQH